MSCFENHIFEFEASPQPNTGSFPGMFLVAFLVKKVINWIDYSLMLHQQSATIYIKVQNPTPLSIYLSPGLQFQNYEGIRDRKILAIYKSHQNQDFTLICWDLRRTLYSLNWSRMDQNSIKFTNENKTWHFVHGQSWIENINKFFLKLISHLITGD